MSQESDGKAIMNNLVWGAGIGASATGLYYLAKKLRKRLDEQLERSKPKAPDYSDIAFDTPNIAAFEQKKLAAFDMYDVATPAMTGGAAAILAAALSDKKNKKRNAILAGLGGGAAGMALNTAPVHKAIANNLPRDWFPWLNFSDKNDTSENYAYGGWRRMANIGGAGLGLLGGKTLYDIATAPYAEAEKKKEQYNSVAKARKQYFDALLKKEPADKEKTASVSDLLDVAYEQYAEKAGSALNTAYDYTIGNSFGPWNWPDLLAKYLTLGITGATVGGGLLGAKYMYDKTTSESKAKNLAKAISARERMKGSLPVWVDPQELANVTDVAKAKDQRSAVGV